MKVKFHRLKTWPPYFQQIMDGEKTFDVRKNDRDFLSDDYLVLEEYIPDTGLTGRVVVRKIGTIVQGDFGLEGNVCVMSLLSA